MFGILIGSLITALVRFTTDVSRVDTLYIWVVASLVLSFVAYIFPLIVGIFVSQRDEDDCFEHTEHTVTNTKYRGSEGFRMRQQHLQVESQIAQQHARIMQELQQTQIQFLQANFTSQIADNHALLIELQLLMNDKEANAKRINQIQATLLAGQRSLPGHGNG